MREQGSCSIRYEEFGRRRWDDTRLDMFDRLLTGDAVIEGNGGAVFRRVLIVAVPSLLHVLTGTGSRRITLIGGSAGDLFGR